MTDEERDQIDTDAETYMRTCSVAIQTLKNEGTRIYHIHVIYNLKVGVCVRIAN